MGPIWGRQDPGGPHVGPMNFAIWVVACSVQAITWTNADHREQILVKFDSKYEVKFSNKKFISKCRLQHGGHFVPASRYLQIKPAASAVHVGLAPDR